jgi:16S rRNA (uracil1498-N3)-methyltransferase
MGVLGAPEPLSARLRAGPARGGLVLIGPEGGLSLSEQARWAGEGVAPVALGAHVLRTETASLAALAAFQTSWDRL